jgi:hypothetical protein
MWEDVAFAAIILLTIIGFCLTREAGGMPGGLEDPARNKLAEYTPLGDHVSEAGIELEQNAEDNAG